MKIAILSDSHDNWEKLKQGVESANKNKCRQLFFVGDLISPPGVSILEQFKGKVFMVFGNNEGEKVALTRLIDTSETITLTGDIYETTVDGIRFFMNHYPRISELAALSGEFDVCIHGHNHEYRNEKVGNTRLLNPGEIQGYKTGVSTYIIFDTKVRTVQKITL
ncbi:MAG: YfcE family phosphodiesterase [Candidatus Roizmanbacteria bacterium]|nr:YfcE family phosphodiesterase [Candidatus Roizmanbacteria bacterium]